MQSTRNAFLVLALCPTFPGARAEEYALRFGGDQFLHLPPLEIPTEHTVELWVRPASSTAGVTDPLPLLEWGGSLSIRLSGSIVDAGLDLGGGAPVRVSAGGIEPGRWTHLAASFDGRRMRLFLDGRLANVRIALGNVAGHAGFSARIGALDGARERRFAGEIDEVRWWSRARTEDEIRADYRSKAAGGEPGLAGCWSFDEGAGQVAADRTASRRQAVLGPTRFADPGDPAWVESTSPVRKPDPDHRLVFDPPGPLSLKSGDEFGVRCVLSSPASAAAPPLRSWSISLRHDRLLLFLVDVGLEGTTIEPYAARGFTRFEWLDGGPEGAGFVGRGVLDDAADTLPVAGEISLAAATYRPLAPRDRDEAVTLLRFEEGLPGEAGVSRNAIRAGDRQLLPVESALEIRIRSPAAALGFEQEAGVQVLPGGSFGLDCLLAVAEESGSGPQSWSISVQHDPRILEVVEATTAGTVVDRASTETGVFQITELVDNETGAGFLSAVILGIDRPFSLPPAGEEKIARARYRVKDGVPAGTLTGIAYRDGLQQSGVPIENLVVFLGGPTRPQMGSLPVRVINESFVRGDFNSDRRVNMTDAASLLVWLFGADYRPRCLEAGDANDDGRVDLGDAVFLLRALFQGERQPPEPYPAPGPDLTPDALGCEN